MEDQCTYRDIECVTNLPLFTVLTIWFQRNNGIDLAVIPGVIMYLGILSFVAWLSIKFFYRIIKLLIRPIILFFGLFVVLYTKQYSQNDTVFDFILNFIANAITLVVTVAETIMKIVSG